MFVTDYPEHSCAKRIQVDARAENSSSMILIQSLRDGEEIAAQNVVNEYLPVMVGVARNALAGVDCSDANEEDIVQSALGSFFRAAKSGRFPELSSREGIKRLLCRMTVRKAVDLLRRKNAWKRGQGRIYNESSLPTQSNSQGPFTSIACGRVSPDIEAILQESFRDLLAKLGDRELEFIALAKLDGLENADIANSLDCSLRTIERRVQLIRKIWRNELQEVTHEPSPK